MLNRITTRPRARRPRRRSRPGSLTRELGFPSEKDMEVPLLIALYRAGGAIWFSCDGAWLEEVLADHFELSKHAREYSDPARFTAKGGRVWRNHIQWVRKRLVDQGMIDNRRWDRWVLTERGIARVREALSK